MEAFDHLWPGGAKAQGEPTIGDALEGEGGHRRVGS